MERAEPRERLRVGILGKGPDAASWASVLSGPQIDVIYGADLPKLLKEKPGLILAFADHSRGARIASKLAGLDHPPALTLLLAGEGQGNPNARLITALVEAKQEWEGTFDAILDPIAILDSGGLVVRANLGLARAASRSIQEIIGLGYSTLLGPPEPGSSDYIAESLADRSPRTGETRYATLPGVRQVTTSPLAEWDARPGGLVVILKDVTELKEQQERLLQAARLADVGQLAAGVAHEINTPLASIALRTESLLKSAEDPRLQEIGSFKNFPRYLKTIDEEIFRCKKIISALLEFSRSRKAEVRDTDVNALAERAADLVGHQMKLKQITLSLRVEPDLPRIRADDDRLRQALITLLMNALDATPAGGHVEIETRREPAGGVVLSVKDDGAGIARENLDKIFSPFFTTKPVGKGTGLGLAICHGIVASHGGEIKVESEVGRGARFSLVLPADASAAESRK